MIFTCSQIRQYKGKETSAQIIIIIIVKKKNQNTESLFNSADSLV